jgi:hypothetical protein
MSLTMTKNLPKRAPEQVQTLQQKQVQRTGSGRAKMSRLRGKNDV